MNTSTTKHDIPGELCIMNLEGNSPAEQHVMQYLLYDTDYIVIPRCPSTREECKAAGYSDKQIETAWLSFKKYAKKCVSGEPTRFSKDDCMKYNIKDGLIAIYTESAIKVAKPFGFQVARLIELGFKHDENLFVPFTHREAYYNRTNDTLFVLW